jgi:hypothetical protein
MEVRHSTTGGGFHAANASLWPAGRVSPMFRRRGVESRLMNEDRAHWGRRDRATVPACDGWSPCAKGSMFDSNFDSFFQPASLFGAQPTKGFDSENSSVARNIKLCGEQKRRDFRNLVNRTRLVLRVT